MMPVDLDDRSLCFMLLWQNKGYRNADLEYALDAARTMARIRLANEIRKKSA
jgi:hypothetical protein